MRSFLNGESKSIAATSFSEPQDGGFVVTGRFIGFALVVNQQDITRGASHFGKSLHIGQNQVE